MTTEAPKMPLKSLAPWFGGKRTIARRIIAELGDHAQYFEPFCGSMAVLLAKPLCRQETANDLHEDLHNLARVVQDEAAAVVLYNRLQRTIVCDGILDDARGFLESEPFAEPDEPWLERAYWYFVGSWMARNGTSGTEREDYQLAVRWTAGGGSPSIRFRNATESLPAWHYRLKNVVILRRDGFEILPKFEDAGHTAIYVDVPYLPETRGKMRYRHEIQHDDTLFGPSDHRRLRSILGQFCAARIVVSYYDHPEIRRLYQGWRILEIDAKKNLSNQNDRDHRIGIVDAPEILITNG